MFSTNRTNISTVLLLNWSRSRNDLIIECFKGILPIKIKFTQKINQRDLRALKDFIKERNCPIGWVVHNYEKIERLDDKILGIPATLFMIN